MTKLRKTLFFFLLYLAGGPATALWAANTVDPDRGVDSKVDYQALAKIGVWDDRNYALRAADVALLSPNEAQARDPIPAFFRIELRRRNSSLPTEGSAQYPRSALQRFERKYFGYLINGRIYREVERASDGSLTVLTKGGKSLAQLKSKSYQKAVLAAESRVSGPALGGAETAVAINPVNTQRVIAGSNGPYEGQTMWYSADGGASWTRAGAPPGTNICCDPTVDFSSNGAVAYTATLGDGVYVYRSTDNGQTWGTNVVVPTTTGDVDKEYLHVDRADTSSFKDNVYICWHLNNVHKFSRSTNQGVSFSTPLTFSSEPEGIGCDLASDRSGALYYAFASTLNDDGKIIVLKSTNGGVSFGAGVMALDLVDAYDFAIPAMSARRAFIYPAIDVDTSTGAFSNSVYVATTDTTAAESATPANNHARIRVARSRDGGVTWANSTPHETADANSVDRFHPWLKVDRNGRVHVVYYDTRNSTPRTGVDFFYSYSTDGAVTWSTPVRLTTINTPKPNDGFEWGDYNGMDLQLQKAIGIFTDNRDEGGGSGDSVDAYSTRDFAVTAPSDQIWYSGFE